MRYSIAAAVLLVACVAAPALAQFKDGDVGGAKLGTTAVQKWQAGIILMPSPGAFKSVVAYGVVPMEWPEQQVKVAEQDISPGARVSYQTFDESLKAMVVRMPLVSANEEMKALVTFEVRRAAQLPPEDKGSLAVPDPKKLDSALRRYLGASLKIEARDSKIRRTAKEIVANKEKGWDKVEAIYDWVRDRVKYTPGTSVKGALAAMRDGDGSHEDLSSLFIALCRGADIPARTVWVPEFCYAEFYLMDAKGEGHWIPCQPAGAKIFGEMPDTKLILAKGDNFRPPVPPYDPHKRQLRYLSELFTCVPLQKGTSPRWKFVHQLAN